MDVEIAAKLGNDVDGHEDCDEFDAVLDGGVFWSADVVDEVLDEVAVEDASTLADDAKEYGYKPAGSEGPPEGTFHDTIHLFVSQF